MKKIHVFNPEHDLALAFGGSNFTSPTAGRKMRAFIGALPAIWANDGDIVLVDNMKEAMAMMSEHSGLMANVRLMSKDQLKVMTRADWDNVSEISPWGWDAALKWDLKRLGVPSCLLPDQCMLDAVRQLSNRESSICVLEELVAEMPNTVGERVAVHSLEELKTMLSKQSRVVVKAPWSSSGRGVRFYTGVLTSNLEGFVKNILKSQGSIILEPAYDKVVDFAMEFVSDGKGKADYSGLSLFDTDNGAYLGNVLADEEQKLGSLSHYADVDVLRLLASKLSSMLGKWCQGKYRGPLGVDMMIVKHGGCFLLHPCVEINVRRTMGHVAINLARHTAGRYALMRIVCNKGQYHMVLS